MKINKRKISYLIAIILAAFVLLPNALAEKYFEVTNQVMDSSPIEYPSFGYDWANNDEIITSQVNLTGDFSFKLKTYELVADKNYVVTLKSDYYDKTYTFTGAELNTGVTIEIEDAKSTIDLKVKDKTTGDYVKYQHLNNCGEFDMYCQPIDYVNYFAFRFDDTQDYSEVIAKFNSLKKNGKIKVNTIELGEEALETAITTGLNSIYNMGKFDAYGYCYDGQCYISITDTTNTRHTKTFEVEYEFAKANNTIKAKINKYVKKFNFNFENIEENLFALVDLENINYKYATLSARDTVDSINSIINYSSEIQSYFDNDNVTLALDTRAGWFEDFTAGGFGFLNIMYNGTVYGVAEPVGVKQVNIMYVPDGTPKTREAFIAAAKERIESYLKDVKVEITYGGQIADINTNDWIFELSTFVDVSKTTGEWYNIKINGETFKFFIQEDSKYMNTPFMNTRDIDTNIFITSDSYKVPLDSKVSADVLDENSAEYKELMKKLDLVKGMAVDLKLYSNVLDMYVTKLDDGSFKVYIPLEGKAAKKSYIAYYYGDDGKVEEYKVKVEKDDDGNAYAVFETNHFSTYVLAEDGNPGTYDSITTYLITFVFSIIGVAAVTYKCKNKKA